MLELQRDGTRLLQGSWPSVPPLWDGPLSRWGTHHLSMVEPFFLFPRGYSSRQTNTPAALRVELRNSPGQPEGPQ